MKVVKGPAKRIARAKKIPEISSSRVIIENVEPLVDQGRAPAKRVLGETVKVKADIFSDGHDVLRAELRFRSPSDRSDRIASMKLVENDRWEGDFEASSLGGWTFTIVAWRDPYLTWCADVSKKILAGQDVRTEAQEGVRLLSDVADDGADSEELEQLRQDLQTPGLGTMAIVDLMLSEPVRRIMASRGSRHAESRYPLTLPLWVDRQAARFSSWYELFPRSQGRDASTHGTLKDVIGKLPYVRDLGFDVLYFPPIHPIGTVNRKGKNNSLTAADGDPGSVYAIGAEAGGHEALHPELGTLDDFQALVEEARVQGLEVALDFAVQCAPDHPWIKEHPDWFEWRPDGTIKFAENPPKKYEDIVNLRLEIPEARQALLDIVLLWVARGVRIFRVDNPHTKPVPFWEWLIASVNREYPDVIFLAEAFTKPKMMRKLAKIGFQQSYTYFTWRNTKQELIDYVTELAGEMGEYYRPNFFVNTPDINPYYLQQSGRPGFIVRATLAATLSSNWGMYSGYEICEAAALNGREEYLDSEKYEIKHRDLNASGNIKNEIRALNRIRRDHPALQDFRNTMFLNSWNDQVIAYARMDQDRRECIFVMANLDPHHSQTCTYEVPLWEFGLPDWERFEATDLLRGNGFNLEGKTHVITLDPSVNPVVIWRLRPPSVGMTT